jgi:hypothetical protein
LTLLVIGVVSRVTSFLVAQPAQSAKLASARTPITGTRFIKLSS